MTGRTILHYHLTEQIGEGGMGVVWKAHDTVLDRIVALKFLHDTGAADVSRRQRFFREARAASALNHPNIVTIHEIHPDGDEPFIVMELVRGRSLSTVIRQQMRISPSLAVEWVLQLCTGLGAAHRAGLVHRDVKPSNIMLTEDGVIKLLDFGLAKPSDSADPPTGCGDPAVDGLTVRGTAQYMSPEQATNGAIGAWSDVFSVGVVLYEMLTGRLPFYGSSNNEILQAVVSEEPAPLSVIAPHVPESLAQIVHQCLQKNPARRYRDAGEVATHLRGLDRSSWPRPDFDSPTATMDHVPRIAVFRGPRKWMAAAGLLLMALLPIGGIRAWRAFWGGGASQLAATTREQSDALRRAQDYLERYDRKGNVDSAVATLEKIAQGGRAGANVHATLAEAYVRKYYESADNQWRRKAVESGRRAVQLMDDLAAAHVSLGTALAANGQKAEAGAEFERARELNPLSGAAYTGLAKLRTGTESQELHRQAVKLSPGHWIPLNELAGSYYFDARYDECIETWQEALLLVPDNYRVLVNIGIARHMKGQYAEAAGHFQKALSLEDSSAIIWANLGTARYFQGNYQDAVRATQRAVDLAPGRYLYWGNLGDNYRWAPGQREKAGEPYRTAIRLAREELQRNPEDVPARSSLAVYLAKSGNLKGGLVEIDQVRSNLDKAGLFKAALVYELAGERSKALELLERGILAGYSMHEVANEPELAALRSDPRYSRLAAGAAEKQ